MNNNVFKIIKLLIDETLDIHGVEAVSLVHDPAIQRDFYAFQKENELPITFEQQYRTDFKEVQGEKRKVVGPLLIPNKMILRRTLSGDYFYVYFDKETIRQTAERFQENKNQNNSTLEHDEKLSGVTMIETWIKEDEVHDKSNLYGFEDMPVGTWFGMAKIKDDETWKKIKSGEVKGFSIEGRYCDELLEASEQKTELESIEDMLPEIIMEGTPEEIELYTKIMELIDSYNQENE